MAAGAGGVHDNLSVIVTVGVPQAGGGVSVICQGPGRRVVKWFWGVVRRVELSCGRQVQE